jgi:hypothetical protein
MAKLRVLKDKAGKVIATINDTSDSRLVPLDADVEGGKMEEREVSHRDLLDIERLHQKLQQ